MCYTNGIPDAFSISRSSSGDKLSSDCSWDAIFKWDSSFPFTDATNSYHLFPVHYLNMLRVCPLTSIGLVASWRCPDLCPPDPSQFLPRSAHQGKRAPQCHSPQARKHSTNAPPQDDRLPTIGARLPSFVSSSCSELLWPKCRVWHLRGNRGALGSQPTCQVLLGLGVPTANTPSERTWWVGVLPRGRAQSPSVPVLLRPPTGYLAIWPDTNFSSSVFEPHPSLAWLDSAHSLSDTINFPSYVWGWPWSSLLGWVHVFPLS